MTLGELIRGLMKNRPGSNWSEGDGENEPRWGGADWKNPWNKDVKVPKIPLIIGALVLLFIMCFSGAVEFYTDVLWFESLGLVSVLWRRLLPQAAIFVLSAVVTFAVYNFNWRMAIRIGTEEFRKTSGIQDATLVNPLYATACAVLLAILAGIGHLRDWPVVMQFLNSSPFGETDVIFGHDIGFYIFTLPLARIIQSWAVNLCLTSLAGSALAYMLCRSLRSEGAKIMLISRARLHVLSLAAIFLCAFGAGLWMSRYELLYSPTGIVYGIGYVDLHLKLPGLSMLSISTIAASALLLINFYKPMWRASVALVGVLLAAGFLSQTVLPSVVQNYIVQPNEYELEKEFIGRHLDATRKAFTLDRVTTFQVTPESDVTTEDMREDSDTVENIRLWDYAPLLRTYKQLQEIRTYYEFEDIDIDRYRLNGKDRQVMLSVRELDQAQLQNRTWVNSHLEFTHGYGIVMNPVNEMEEGGLPVFFIKDLPPRSTVPIALDRPEIYYGEKRNSYALVKTDVKEFDYPMGDSNVRSSYEGSGGVPLHSLARRLLYAIKFRDSEIIFTDSLTPESRVLYNRNVKDAIRKVAPFLILENDIYPVIVGGRIVWLQDAYTASSAYPYSRPLPQATAAQIGLAAYSGVNYIRNSVKVTMDAYDGRMTFYVTDRNDPLIKSWAGIFPGLFKPMDAIPDDIAAHFRYPEEYFEVQSEVYRIYHMTDTNTYYNREDVWMTTPQGYERRIRPNYVTIQLMEESHSEFTLIAPFMPFGRNNLIGWIAGRCDAEHYGELVVYQFPKQELLFGPAQIEALIDQNTSISSQLSLWSQRGSDVIRGDLLVIPIGKSLLYVQPLYLKAERGEMPELKRVILSTGGRVAWGETFDEAVLEIFGSAARTNQALPTSVTGETQPDAQPSASSVEWRQDSTLRELAMEALTHYEGAGAAVRSGDWGKYGDELDMLGKTLMELERLTGE
ncbi:MAG: UPF0182 family protein [Synergistaceae bacterium]|jgi:uncharacterized membrane protein (UPF0182 family)|nr:UPF0182 family protein [Synergistaceae bacterium]